MTVFRNNNQYDQSNIEIKNNRIIRYDKINRTKKMTYIDYGFSFLKKEAFLNDAKTPYDLSQVIQQLILTYPPKMTP